MRHWDCKAVVMACLLFFLCHLQVMQRILRPPRAQGDGRGRVRYSTQEQQTVG